jgi:hypothetical protein
MIAPTWTPGKSKVTTVLTQTRYGDEEDGRRDVIGQWSKVVPRIFVVGPVAPPKEFGVRWAGNNHGNIRNLISAYMFQMPGNEVVALAAPDILINKDQSKLFEFINSQRYGLAWAAHANIDGKPRIFIMAGSVVAHIMRDIPQTLSITGNDWKEWVHAWLDKYMMKPRYINATDFGIIQDAFPKPVEAPSPVLNAYTMPEPEIPVKVKEPAPAPKRKAGRPKKTTP